MSANNPTTSKPTQLEVAESLDGFDEAAIERAFGKEIDDLSVRAFSRALIFTLKRREGLDDTKAKHAALAVTIAGLAEHFTSAAEADEVDDDDPDTEVGKDGSAPA